MNTIPCYKKIAASLLIFGILLGLSSASHAAFCSLRDPVETINTLYPNSTSFKSSVKIIDEGIRDRVQELLPPNTLHFSELGKHTLYIAFNHDAPIGYVHVRSEESQWGLVEIAWAIDLDLKVKDFKFQRCRNRQKKVLEDENFRQQLRGRDFEAFTTMLKADGRSLNTDVIQVTAKAQDLAQIVLLCGMKTLLVTQLAWEDEITQYRNQKSALTHFDDAVSTKVVSKGVNTPITATLNTAFGGANTGIDRNSVVVTQVFDQKQKMLGMIYEGDIAIDQKTTRMKWIMEPDGKVIHVENRDGWQAVSTKRAFEKTVGKSYASSQDCNDRAELLTLEAVLTSRSLLSL